MLLVYGEKDTLLKSFRGDSVELSFITHYYLITLLLHVGQDGKLLFAVDNSIFGYLTSSLPVFFVFFCNDLSCNSQFLEIGRPPRLFFPSRWSLRVKIIKKMV